MADKKKAVSILVPSKDPKEKKDGDGGGGGGDKEVPSLDGVGVGGAGDANKGAPKKKGKTKGGKDILEPEELSEEDKALKEGLELAVTRVDDKEPGIGESIVPAIFVFVAVLVSCSVLLLGAHWCYVCCAAATFRTAMSVCIPSLCVLAFS